MRAALAALIFCLWICCQNLVAFNESGTFCMLSHPRSIISVNATDIFTTHPGPALLFELQVKMP